MKKNLLHFKIMEANMNTDFILKNFYIDGQRTSLRLDRESYKAVQSICNAEKMPFGDLMNLLEKQRENDDTRMSRTAYLRTFVIHYLQKQIQEHTSFSEGDRSKIKRMMEKS